MRYSKLSNYCYFSFKHYIRFIHEWLFVGKRYTIGAENIPAKGERFFIVCNHQNAANDPINIMFSLPFDRRLCAMARANVFSVHPILTAFLDWMGVMPAFRFGWEGGDGLEQNYQSFNLVAERVNDQYPLIIFPEAGHTQGHYMQRFTTGTVRMAFYAAKANGWIEDIKILPTAHHYADYFGLRSDFMLTICPPISLKPYYEEYQQNPNKVMRRLTHQLHEAVHANILDEGIEDYEAKDFLRQSALNPSNIKEKPLPQRMREDQQFIDRLIQNPSYPQIISLATRLLQAEKALGINEQTLLNSPTWPTAILQTLLLLLILPIWVISLWPNALCYWLPTRFLKTDKMFTNSYRYVMATLLIYPLTALLTLLLLGLSISWWWQSLLWILLWVPFGRFSWWYYQQTLKLKRSFKSIRNPKKVNEINQLRQEIKNLL